MAEVPEHVLPQVGETGAPEEIQEATSVVKALDEPNAAVGREDNALPTAAPHAPGAVDAAPSALTAAASLPPDDFDVICSDERDLLGNFLVRDLIFHHGTRTDGGGGGKSVADIADRIVKTVTEGVAFAVAGEGRYGGGRFLLRVEDSGAVTVAAYRELDAEEAKSYISRVFHEAFPQYAMHHSAPKTEIEDQEKKSGDSQDEIPSSATPSDVLLLNSSVHYPNEEVYALHPGNQRFVEFLNGASCGLESSGLDSSPGAATARAQLFIASVDFVRGSVNRGEFLAQTNGSEWANLNDELAIWEAITVLLWRKFLERERQKLLSPPPPQAPMEHTVEHSTVQPPGAAAVAVTDALPAESALASSTPRRYTVRANARESQQYCRWPADYQVVPPSDQPVSRPTDHDVLFGRGGLTNHHPGNKRFRDVIAVHRADYVEAIKIEKPNVARNIVRAIRCGLPPGRFLKKSSKDGMWYDVGDRHAAEKASQALREKSQAEKYEKIALEKHAQAAIRGSKIAKGTAPFGTVAMPPLAGGIAPPAAMPGPAVVPYPPPPPGHTMYGMVPNPGVPPHAAGTELNGENDVTTGTKRKASAKEAEAGKDTKKPKTSGDSSSTELYTPIDPYGNVVVTDHDILCGRGGLTNHHLGNKRFRDIVSLHRPDYIRAPKIEKPSVARMIVSAIRHGNPPGRFIKKDFTSGKWYDIGDKRAAEKASQALREKTPEERIAAATKHDRPMPTRQYFSPSSAAEDLPFANASEGTSANTESKEPKEETTTPLTPTPASPPKAGKSEDVIEV